MSIYATGWMIKVPRKWHGESEWVGIIQQVVLGHIGQPSEGYETDPYSDFLPKITQNYDVNSDSNPHRAVVLIQENHEEKDGQRYIDPIAVLSWEDYKNLTFQEVLNLIHDNLK
jgi:hypothetical protein